MIDLHTHTLISDGCLLPSELARRAAVAGYEALAITDHADDSNIDFVLKSLKKVSRELGKNLGLRIVPGVELTHIPPAEIARMVKKARRLGAAIVVGHGETLAEPVAPGTNTAFITSRVDILAHPGLITEEDTRLAKKNSVHLEITTRRGHSLSNGHVALMAKTCGAKLVLNTDAHGPSDLVSDEAAERIAMGSGLGKNDFSKIQKNARELLKKIKY
ncbi:MAG: histidinol phosphate phosphatase domain-containing protein [Thermodesulfobacteriota bacterium]|nr:MAG: histidinol phosphate phosphatase domain-containing protein [Thermodesulfobacteriota bacterium]